MELLMKSVILLMPTSFNYRFKNLIPGIKLKFCIAASFLIFVFSIAFAQDTVILKQYQFEIGTGPNIESGIQTAFSLSSLIFDQTSLVIKKAVKDRTANCFARIANYGFIQVYFGTQLYATLPHEYFGHYGRAREFGINSKINLNFPALGGGTVFLTRQSTPAIQRQLIMAAGPEVTADIAFKATQQLYSDDYSPSYIGNFLIAGKLIDQYLYVQNNVKPFIENPNRYYAKNARWLKSNPVPNDPLAYTLALTESYGYYDGILNKDSIWVQQFADMAVYTRNGFIKDQYRRMKTAYLLAAVDPANLFFLYGNALYLIKGQTFFKPFMLRIKDVSFMPSVRVNMGELGVENYYDIFFKINKFPSFNVYYRNGGNMFHQINGAGTEFRNIGLTNRINLTAQVDYWHNGRIRTNNFNVLTGFQYYDKNRFFSFGGNIGYKSYGNLMGKPFTEGIYGYMGFGIMLRYKKE